MKLIKKFSLAFLMLFFSVRPVEAVATQLGDIDTDPQSLVRWILTRAVYVGGGIAFLLLFGGGFTLITSSGDPEKLNKGKETIISALTGLLFIIFSLFLLRFIGVDILQIPDISK